MTEQFDIIIIGGGVVGSALARELSAYKLKIAVMEKNRDVCFETSGRNSGVAHGGFAMAPGTLKAKFCVEGNQMMGKLSQELDFRFERTGKVLVGFEAEERASLERTMQQGIKNGVRGLEIIEKERLHELVQEAEGNFALYSPDSGILDPFEFTIGLAECAVNNGVKYFFNHEVTAIRLADGSYQVETLVQEKDKAEANVFQSRWVINAAGLGCAKVAAMMDCGQYKLLISKGDYIILDKAAGAFLPMPVYPVPSNMSYGTHVTNTVDGNVLIGPFMSTASQDDYYGVSQKNMNFLSEDGAKIWHHVLKKDFIRNYSGLIPKWLDENGEVGDFRIDIDDEQHPRAVNIIGIQSPGLTAAVPIALYVIEQIKERENLEENPAYNPYRRGMKHFHQLSEEEQAEIITQNPDYGEVICRCEKVTKAEILQAIHNPLGTATVASVKYRTRAMMGRCQGGYCQMRIASLLESELGIPTEELVFARNGSEIFTGKIR